VYGGRDVEKLVRAHESDVCGFHGDVGTGCHGDADIGDSEGRRIVDTVPDHGDYFAEVFHVLDEFLFLVWAEASMHVFGVNADGASNSEGGRALVASNHGDFEV